MSGADKSKKASSKEKETVEETVVQEEAVEEEVAAAEDKPRNLLDDIKEKLSEAANKGIEALKVGSERASQFANEATNLARLKIDLRNLKEERNRVYKRVGEGLWNAYKAENLSNVQELFAEEFQRLEELKDKIAATEQQVEEISLLEKHED